MFIQDYRASKILYNFLTSNNIKGKFLIPANVCAIIPLVFHAAKIDFDFVDIENDTLCIDQQEVINRIDQYAGVLFVRSYGIEKDFESFFKSIKELRRQFIIIDDSCLCLPNVNHNLSENVDLKLYSLGYAKQVDMTIGAFALLNNSFLYKDIQTTFRDPDFDRYQTELKQAIATNTIFNPRDYCFLENKEYKLNIEVLTMHMERVIVHKKHLNNIYQNELPENIQLREEYQHWRFNILLDAKSKATVFKMLFNKKLFASSHYVPLSEVWKNQVCPNASVLSKRIINLFNDFYYTEKQALATCAIINNNLWIL